MGIGSKVIEKGIEEIGKTIRKPENTEQSIELGEPSSKPCLLYTSPSPRDLSTSRMPSSA